MRISVVIVPLHGCVGSGCIANENWEFIVLLGRLLCTATVGRLFPAGMCGSNAFCITTGSILNLYLILCASDV